LPLLTLAFKAKQAKNARSEAAKSRFLLKIRLVGLWHVGILVAVVFVRVLSADGFL
jgi:hypothetical protein